MAKYAAVFPPISRETFHQLVNFMVCLTILLYRLFCFFLTSCPRFISTFPNFSKFLSEQHSSRFLVWELSRVWRDNSDLEKISKRLVDKKFATPIKELSGLPNPRVEKLGTVFEFSNDSENYSVLVNEDFDIPRQRELFWEIFSPHACYAPVRRNIAWTLIGISFL